MRAFTVLCVCCVYIRSSVGNVAFLCNFCGNLKVLKKGEVDTFHFLPFQAPCPHTF